MARWTRDDPARRVAGLHARPRGAGSYRTDGPPPAPVVDRRAVEVELLTGLVSSGVLRVDQVVPMLTDGELQALPWARLIDLLSMSTTALRDSGKRAWYLATAVLTVAQQPRLTDEVGDLDEPAIRDCAVVIMRRWFPGKAVVARA